MKFYDLFAGGGETGFEMEAGGVQLTAQGQFSCLWQALTLPINRLDGIIMWLPQLRKPALICMEKCIASRFWWRLAGWYKVRPARGRPPYDRPLYP